MRGFTQHLNNTFCSGRFDKYLEPRVFDLPIRAEVIGILAYALNSAQAERMNAGALKSTFYLGQLVGANVGRGP